MDPKVLIVGTVPYNKATTARAFEAYFRGWDRNCLTQIFSNSKKPIKGHSGRLFQITDKRMLQRVFDKTIQTGKEFVYEELADAWENNTQEESGIYSKLYQWGSRKTPFIYLARGNLSPN